jgi:membrane protease YdiL (CAAX protease family)
MLFLLKRSVAGSLLGLLVLALLGVSLRGLVGGPPLVVGAGAFVVVLAVDGALHGLLCLTFGKRYQSKYRELVELFQNQSFLAMLAGAALAGVGEELLFRGLSADPLFLIASATVFGLLHHVRRSLWPFTLWATFEGLLFGVALVWTGVLCVPMVCHFLHDLTGFGIFRFLNRRAPAS